ncbi:hypothetical protein PMIN03_002843 [Paraphaeosphaeria minitans]
MQTKILMALVMLIVAILLGLSAEDEMDIGTKPPWCKNLQYSRQTCNPPEPGHPNCAHTWEEHCILWQKMSDATKAAHAAEVRITIFLLVAKLWSEVYEPLLT